MHAQALQRRRVGESAQRHKAPQRSVGWGISSALSSASLPAIVALVITGLLTATRTTRNAEPIDVSVRDVVIDPYAVDGKLVRLYGFFHHTREGDALYWHEADIKQSIASHAVGLQYSSPQPSETEPDGRHVVVEGIFYARKPERRASSSEAGAVGHQYNGELVDARPVQ